MPDSGSPIEAPGIATITTPVLIKPDICSGEVVSAAGSTTFPVGGSSTETTLTSSSPTKHLRGPPFGVLKTGNLLKRNPNRPFDKPKRRFFILTSVALHWFKREDGYDLFGDERGNINLHDMSKVDLCAILPDNPSSHGDAFEVCCHQDSVHRIFQASSPEEARAWVSALKGAKKARPTFRRETLSGLSFSPHGHNYDKEPPLVSVVTLKKGEAGEEVVLAKAPQYQYGENFRLPLDPRASSPPPLSQTLCILLSNGDSAEVNTEVLRNCEVGDTLPARVSCLSDQIAVLPLTLRARFQAKTGAVPATPISRPEAFLVSSLSAVFLALSTGWSLQDGQGMAKGPGCFHYVERLLFLVLVAFTLLRALCPQLQVYLQKYNAWNGNHGYTTVLEISIDDYVVESRRSKNAEQEEANVLPPIPDRFVNGCFGDMVEAERRWRITLAWRKNFGTDTILEREHPYFDLVKQALPAFYCGTARDGNPVYYERSGQTDLAKAKEVGLDWMVYNYVHSTEFVFKVLHPRETARTVTIFDVEGLSLGDIAGDPLEFIRRATHVMQEHYPERCRVIIICNCPGWFSFVWKIIRPLVNETTQQKVKIVSKSGTFKAINEFVEADQIPVEYGGSLRFGDGEDSCRWLCPEEQQLREHVQAINERFKEERAARGEPEPDRMEPIYGD